MGENKEQEGIRKKRADAKLAAAAVMPGVAQHSCRGLHTQPRGTQSCRTSGTQHFRTPATAHFVLTSGPHAALPILVTS